MNYTKRCWSCGKVTMVNKGAYYQCSNCGATWNELPSPDFSPLADHGYYLRNNEGTFLLRAQSPSKTVTRQARKKREADRGGKQ